MKITSDFPATTSASFYQLIILFSQIKPCVVLHRKI